MNGSLNLHPKVAGGTLSGAVALIIISVLSHWLTISAEVAAAITLIVAGVGGWLTPLATGQPPVETHSPVADPPVVVDPPVAVPIVVVKSAETTTVPAAAVSVPPAAA